jgi:hypothetical protein
MKFTVLINGVRFTKLASVMPVHNYRQRSQAVRTLGDRHETLRLIRDALVNAFFKILCAIRKH